MSQYKYLVKLFRYTKYGDNETIQFMRFDPSIPPPTMEYVRHARKDKLDEEETHCRS
jgi:hypothetical protein